MAHVSQVGGSAIPTGIVTFANNGGLFGQARLDATGTAVLTRSDFLPGPHTITADYSGDITDRASRATITLNVTGGSTAVQTTTTLVAVPNPIGQGATVTLTAHVVQTGTATPPPAGALVTFRTLIGTGGALLGEAPLDANGNATLVVPGWIAGQYLIEADYAGDTFNLPSGLGRLRGRHLHPPAVGPGDPRGRAAGRRRLADRDRHTGDRAHRRPDHVLARRHERRTRPGAERRAHGPASGGDDLCLLDAG
jgi:hypothetical protein